MTSLKIAVADDEASMREYFQDILTRLGHKVISVSSTGKELVDGCRTEHPDMVITDIRMPDMDGIDAASKIYEIIPVPVILVSAYHDSELIDRALKDYVMAYLIKPIKMEHLEPTIAIAMRRFAQFQALCKEASGLRQALQDRKVIERAKGILMKKSSLDEEEAFRRLQKVASSKNQKLVEIAQMVVTAGEVLDPPGKERR